MLTPWFFGRQALAAPKFLSPLLFMVEFIQWYLYYIFASLMQWIRLFYDRHWVDVNIRLGACFDARRHAYSSSRTSSDFRSLALEPACAMNVDLPVFTGPLLIIVSFFVVTICCSEIFAQYTNTAMAEQTSIRDNSRAGRHQVTPRSPTDPRSPVMPGPAFFSSQALRRHNIDTQRSEDSKLVIVYSANPFDQWILQEEVYIVHKITRSSRDRVRRRYDREIRRVYGLNHNNEYRETRGQKM